MATVTTTRKATKPKAAKTKKPKRRERFDDSKADLEVSFGFSVARGGGEAAESEQWRSEVRILSAEDWAAEREARRDDRWKWGAVEMEDGRILLCRLRPEAGREVYAHDHHHPATAKAVRNFRSRLLDWLESQPDVGADPYVTLNGEGACTVTFGAPDDGGGHQAVDVVLSHNTHLGEW